MCYASEWTKKMKLLFLYGLATTMTATNFFLQLMVYLMKEDRIGGKSTSLVFDTRISISGLTNFKGAKKSRKDADFIKDVEEALKLHDEGKVKKMNADAFLKEIRK